MAQHIGIAIPESPEAWLLVKIQSTSYLAVNQGQDVEYFANPPTTLQCLHKWKARDGSNWMEYCVVNRSEYYPVRTTKKSLAKKENWFQDHFDLNDVDSFRIIQNRMKLRDTLCISVDKVGSKVALPKLWRTHITFTKWHSYVSYKVCLAAGSHGVHR